MIEIAKKRIVKINQLGTGYTPDDGLGIFRGGDYLVHDCIIDLSDTDLKEQDEAVAVTWGASATFKRCWIKGAGKLILCGSGDKDKRELEDAKQVIFEDCMIEDFGRRGPEVQSGMYVSMQNCVIRNWGIPERFSGRSFGAWAHHGGEIDAMNCVFWQDKFLRPFGQMIRDFKNHWWQALYSASKRFFSLSGLASCLHVKMSFIPIGLSSNFIEIVQGKAIFMNAALLSPQQETTAYEKSF